MKNYLLLSALCSVFFAQLAYAERYTVHDLYALYGASDTGVIITKEVRDDLPYYTKMMSEYVNNFSNRAAQEDLTASQEKVKAAVAVAATLNVFIPRAFGLLENVSDLAQGARFFNIYEEVQQNLRTTMLSGVVLPFAIYYLKKACTHKKRCAQEYEVGKKILAQLEYAQEGSL